MNAKEFVDKNVELKYSGFRGTTTVTMTRHDLSSIVENYANHKTEWVSVDDAELKESVPYWCLCEGFKHPLLLSYEDVGEGYLWSQAMNIPTYDFENQVWDHFDAEVNDDYRVTHVIELMPLPKPPKQ